MIFFINIYFIKNNKENMCNSGCFNCLYSKFDIRLEKSDLLDRDFKVCKNVKSIRYNYIITNRDKCFEYEKQLEVVK